MDAADLAEELGGHFDLVVINDVLHHVPPAQRDGLLTAARRLLAPDGHLVIKDWLRRPTPIHGACYFADAYIGGDRGVRYMAIEEQRRLIDAVFGPEAVVAESSIAPPNAHGAIARARAARSAGMISLTIAVSVMARLLRQARQTRSGRLISS